ncbi:hypothetical protein BD560DRAFT_388778 [Blakeslea trispora]|nr:hypothetical protein BD560DRAFT_388778 [Blakeslea trispora]
MICTLPNEIIEYIGFYLPSKDCLQLILANRLFYDTLIKCMFWDVRIDTLQQLDGLLSQSKNHHLVQHLNIQTDDIKKAHLREIRQSFPHLISIDLILPRWSARHFHDITLIIEQSLPHHLKRITIDIALSYRADVETMKCIFTICPLLESLSIKCPCIDMKCFDKQNQVSVHNLKELTLTISCIWNCWEMFHWLCTIGESYPNLRSLRIKLVSIVPWHAINTSLYFHPSRFSKEHQRVATYNSFFSKCPMLTDVEIENILPDENLVYQLDKQKGLHFTYKSKTPVIDCAFLGLCRLHLSVFSSIRKLDLCYWHDTKNCKRMEILGSTCINLDQLVLRPSSLWKTDPLWVDVVLRCFPRLRYLELNKIELQGNRNTLLAHLGTLHPLEEINIKNCTLLDRCLDPISTCCLELKHMSLVEVRFKHHYNQVSIDLRQQKLRSVSIQQAYISNLCQSIRILHIRSQKKSEWYSMPEHQKQDRPFSNTISKVERLSKEAAQVLDIAMKQHPSAWEDPALYGYFDTSDLYQSIDLLETFPAGHLEIECQSIDMLLINSKCVF